ncbi:unnamed protein product, partial [Heterosigma akashiwo]
MHNQCTGSDHTVRCASGQKWDGRTEVHPCANDHRVEAIAGTPRVRGRQAQNRRSSQVPNPLASVQEALSVSLSRFLHTPENRVGAEIFGSSTVAQRYTIGVREAV